MCTSCKYGLRSALDEKGVLARPPAAHTHHLAAAAELQRGYLRTKVFYLNPKLLRTSNNPMHMFSTEQMLVAHEQSN